MEFEDLELFKEVVRQGSISKAAPVINLTQPTITKRLRNLEENLGMDLFERTSKGLNLLEEGKVFYKYCEEILSLYRQGLDSAKKIEKENIIKVATPASYSEFLLTRLIPIFEEAGLIHEFYHHHSSEIFELVNDEKIDLGILLDDIETEYVNSEVLYQDPIVLCCNSNHWLTEKEEVKIMDLIDEKIALFSWGAQYKYLENKLNEIKFNKPTIRRVSPVSVIKSLIETNNYVAFLPKMTIENELEADKFSIIDVIEGRDWKVTMSFIYKDKSKNTSDNLLKSVNLIKSISW